jgi:SAM-dependent methyltransferase
MHRYAFAATLCSNARVLDAACGEGYGAALVAGVAQEVVGVDVSETAIGHARARYGGQEGLDFQVADCTSLPFPDQHFDRVVSFETIEHLQDQAGMLAEFRRVLSPEGLLILSCPDKAEYTDRQGFDNPFHVRELYRDELETLISGYFPAHRLLGQKLMFHSAIWSLSDEAADEAVTASLQGAGDRDAGIPHRPMYFIAVCGMSGEQLPELERRLWLFDDQEESVYQHYIGEIRRNMAAGGIIADRDREIEGLKAQLEQSGGRSKSWLGRILGRG